MTSYEEFFGNYLSVDDLKVGEEKQVTVKEVKVEDIGREEVKKKVVVYFEEIEKKGLALNRVNADSLKEVSGSKEIEDWAGVKLTLFVDPKVKFGGKEVGGIRIRVPSQGVAPAQ